MGRYVKKEKLLKWRGVEMLEVQKIALRKQE